MKPEHETRRKIIREWMSLPKDKRQTEEQAKLFVKKATPSAWSRAGWQRHRLSQDADPTLRLSFECYPAQKNRSDSLSEAPKEPNR